MILLALLILVSKVTLVIKNPPANAGDAREVHSMQNLEFGATLVCHLMDNSLKKQLSITFRGEIMKAFWFTAPGPS